MSLTSALFALRRFGFVISALLCGLVFAPTASAEKYASIVVDVDTREVLHARNADELRYPASLTKVMTLYLLFDAIDSGDLTLDSKLKVSSFAARQAPSNLRLKTGSTMTVRNAIKALVTKSANDVAVVVAERIGGSEKEFARMMTDKARALGLTQTTFVNASGLPDPDQVTTARDLALLSGALLDHHGHNYHYFAETRFTWGKRTYKNHNELLGRVFGVDGIKTGYTRASGFNLIASAQRDGRRVIAIMLGGNTSRSRDQHVADLIEAAFVSMGVKGPPDLRSQVAFAGIKVPANPNDAAEPMLNGKPLSVILAEGDESEAEFDASTEEDPAGTFEEYTEEGEESETAEAAASGVVNASAPVQSVSDYERQQISR